MSVLSEILAAKRTEVDCAKGRISAEELVCQIGDMEAPRNFLGALQKLAGPALIAEVKKASPSKGVIREDFEPVQIAQTFVEGGASCLSVLTDEPFFQGRLSYLRDIRAAVDLPLLRKDFIIDEYQILESRAAGADAILLIVAALTDKDLALFIDRARGLGMEALVEVHDEDELGIALSSSAEIIGINNRDLHTFRTTLDTTLNLVTLIPKCRFVVSESGINNRADVERLGRAGVGAVLVGESLMRERDIAAKMRELLGATVDAR